LFGFFAIVGLDVYTTNCIAKKEGCEVERERIFDGVEDAIVRRKPANKKPQNSSSAKIGLEVSRAKVRITLPLRSGCLGHDCSRGIESEFLRKRRTVTFGDAVRRPRSAILL